MDAPSTSSTLPGDDERFVLELEMVQCLASADYLHRTSRARAAELPAVVRGARGRTGGRPGGRAGRPGGGWGCARRRRWALAARTEAGGTCAAVRAGGRARPAADAPPAPARPPDAAPCRPADLAEKKYLEDPAFVDFLEYLLYWYASAPAVAAAAAATGARVRSRARAYGRRADSRRPGFRRGRRG